MKRAFSPGELSYDTRSKRKDTRMYHTTGMTKNEILDLCVLAHHAFGDHDNNVGRPRALGLYNSIAVALTYLRRNHVQQELAEFYRASQSTISRIIATWTPRLGELLGGAVPAVNDLDPDEQLIIAE